MQPAIHAQAVVLEPVAGLIEHPRNPRMGDVGAVIESIRANGYMAPIVVQKSSRQVIDGNHRLKAAVALGMPSVPVVWVDVDDATAMRYLLSANRTSDLAAYDDHALVELLTELAKGDGLGGTGYDTDDLDALLLDLGEIDVSAHTRQYPESADDDPGPPPEIAVTQPGDLWTLGEHQLLCGDSRLETDIRSLLGETRADLVFTDPPYGVGYTGGHKPREALAGDEIGTNIYGDSLPNLKWAAADHAALYLWYADAHAAAAAAAAAGYVVTAQIIWVKNNAQFVTAAHYKGKHEICFYAHRRGKTARWVGPNNEVTVWEVNRANKNEFHPTQKPIELAARAMRNSSASGDVVLDLFGGSGSTLMAAEFEGRTARLMEIAPGYCDVICRRWQTHTGRLPERDGVPHDFLTEA